MCPLVYKLKEAEGIDCVVCLTGQHKEMLHQVIDAFGIKADYNLGIMKDRQTLTSITTTILESMEPLLKEVRPDIVLVHGDTTTSYAAALAAFYQQIPVGHVEAGLRTNNIYSPWPEEMNRQITGRIATYDFAPTPLSEKNLQEEKAHGQIFVTGNTVIDALHMVVEKLKTNKALADVGNFLSVLPGCHNYMGLPDYRNNATNASFSLAEVYGTQEFKDYAYSWKEEFRDDIVYDYTSDVNIIMAPSPGVVSVIALKLRRPKD